MNLSKYRFGRSGLKNLDSSLLCLQDIHFRYKDKNTFTVEGQKNVFYENSNQKGAVLLSDKIYFKIIKVTKGKKGIIY